MVLFAYRKLKARDASKFHVQLSLSLLCMLLVFVVGIDRTEVFEGCVTVSVLIHYFTLVAVMFMGAEALLMFQKLVIVFVQITTRYIIIVSLVCWCKCACNTTITANLPLVCATKYHCFIPQWFPLSLWLYLSLLIHGSWSPSAKSSPYFQTPQMKMTYSCKLRGWVVMFNTILAYILLFTLSVASLEKREYSLELSWCQSLLS